VTVRSSADTPRHSVSFQYPELELRACHTAKVVANLGSKGPLVG
jgi:hypothetical protein